MVLPNYFLKMVFYWSLSLCCEPQEQEGNHSTLRSEFNFGVTQSTLTPVARCVQMTSNIYHLRLP